MSHARREASHQAAPQPRRACSIREIWADAKEARNKRIFEMWLACRTQEEIAEAENVARTLITGMADDFVNFGNLADSDKAAASHATDFDIPLYNIWKQQEKTKGASHFGNSEVRWLDNLPTGRAMEVARMMHKCAMHTIQPMRVPPGVFSIAGSARPRHLKVFRTFQNSLTLTRRRNTWKNPKLNRNPNRSTD